MRTWPRITSDTSSGWTLARFNTSLMVIAPRACAVCDARAPLKLPTKQCYNAHQLIYRYSGGNLWTVRQDMKTHQYVHKCEATGWHRHAKSNCFPGRLPVFCHFYPSTHLWTILNVFYFGRDKMCCIFSGKITISKDISSKPHLFFLSTVFLLLHNDGSLSCIMPESTPVGLLVRATQSARKQGSS